MGWEDAITSSCSHSPGFPGRYGTEGAVAIFRGLCGRVGQVLGAANAFPWARWKRFPGGIPPENQKNQGKWKIRENQEQAWGRPMKGVLRKVL